MKLPRLLSCAGLLTLGGVLLGSSAPARADTVTLKNGREIHGRLVEELVDRIRIRTAGAGVIVILKDEIATFSENELDTELTPPSAQREDAGEPGGAAGAQERPQDGGEAGEATGDDWDAGVTDEQKKELTPLRDALRKELTELGPPAAERLAAIALSGPEESQLGERIRAMANRHRQGSANLRRRNALDRVVQEYGVRAIPQLVAALGHQNQWIARMSAQALGAVAAGAKDKAAAQWLLYHFKAPAGLIDLMEHQGEVDSPFLRSDANAALEAISGATQGFVASEGSLMTPPEAQARKAWQSWWSRLAEFRAAEENKRDERRKQVQAQLAQIRKGERPTAEKD